MKSGIRMGRLRRLIGAMTFSATLVISVSAIFGAAQVVNPLFVEASDLYQEIGASSLPYAERAEFGARFSALEAEQQQLWSLAGEVDRIISGGGQVPWLDMYNARIDAWQSALQAFSADARSALQRGAGSYGPTCQTCGAALIGDIEAGLGFSASVRTYVQQSRAKYANCIRAQPDGCANSCGRQLHDNIGLSCEGFDDAGFAACVETATRGARLCQ